MLIDFSPRGSGKTTRMLEWLKADEHRILITFSIVERERLMALIEPPKPGQPNARERIHTWQMFLRRREEFVRADDIGIDNVDIVLRGIFGQGLERVSLSSDGYYENFSRLL